MYIACSRGKIEMNSLILLMVMSMVMVMVMVITITWSFATARALLLLAHWKKATKQSVQWNKELPRSS